MRWCQGDTLQREGRFLEPERDFPCTRARCTPVRGGTRRGSTAETKLTGRWPLHSREPVRWEGEGWYFSRFWSWEGRLKDVLRASVDRARSAFSWVCSRRHPRKVIFSMQAKKMYGVNKSVCIQGIEHSRSEPSVSLLCSLVHKMHIQISHKYK